MESVRTSNLDSSGSSSLSYSSASTNSVESNKDLQKGISLLKRSVACVTAYCYDSLCLDLPSEASTFEAFAKLLAALSWSKEVKDGSFKGIMCHNILPHSAAGDIYGMELLDRAENETLVEEWDFVEHPTYPPLPTIAAI